MPAAPAAFALIHVHVVRRERVPVTTVLRDLGRGSLSAAVNTRERNHGRTMNRKHAPATTSQNVYSECTFRPRRSRNCARAIPQFPPVVAAGACLSPATRALILDPVHVAFHMLEVPAWANRLVLMLMAVGFPAVVIFAWIYEITPEGLKPTVEVPHGQSIRKLAGAAGSRDHRRARCCAGVFCRR